MLEKHSLVLEVASILDADQAWCRIMPYDYILAVSPLLSQVAQHLIPIWAKCIGIRGVWIIIVSYKAQHRMP